MTTESWRRWLTGAGTGLGAALTLIGISGVPDDIAQWSDWLQALSRALDGELIRWVVFVLGMALMLASWFVGFRSKGSVGLPRFRRRSPIADGVASRPAVAAALSSILDEVRAIQNQGKGLKGDGSTERPTGTWLDFFGLLGLRSSDSDVRQKIDTLFGRLAQAGIEVLDGDSDRGPDMVSLRIRSDQPNWWETAAVFARAQEIGLELGAVRVALDPDVD